MQFAMAAALVARHVGLQELTDDFVRRPEVQALFPRVSLEGTAVIKEGSNFAPFDAVEITTTGGETLKSGPVEYAKGSHQRPLSRDELWTKFAECLGARIPGDEEIAGLREFDDVRPAQRRRRSRFANRLSSILVLQARAARCRHGTLIL